MYSYYLCSDNDTIYRIEFSLKQEDKQYYLALLEKYLTELVFVEESSKKDLVAEEKINNLNSDEISIKDQSIFLEKTIVTDTKKIDDDLPFIVKVKRQKYFFLRSYTICLLVRLLSKELDRIDSP